MGVADSAADHWRVLAPRTTIQVIGCYHASGYLADAARAAHPRDLLRRRTWLDCRCPQLKHEPGAAGQRLAEIKQRAQQDSLSDPGIDPLTSAITYVEHHQHPLDYARCARQYWPIGSGVTEAAGKTLVKQRWCQSGMKWKPIGAGIMLSLRALVLTKTRWHQFWERMDQYGFPVAA